ncbi:MAG TPA: metalloregulator ArsR/SmtB family transcription factor [Mycobacteriales bacterium]|nr:metalloregulator ArsR/SmtB family transcription factor [Mycobacteriales bacterium]
MRDLARLEPAVEQLKALAAPVRLGVVEQLAHGPRCVHELTEALGVSQPLVSQHLRVLRGARLVRAGRRGREVEYALADDHVAHVVLDLLRHAGEPPAPLDDLPETDHHEEPA